VDRNVCLRDASSYVPLSSKGMEAMSQFDHYVVSIILFYVTWFAFWNRLFFNQTTTEERKYWTKKSFEFLDRFF
jgi:hypothetical protein